MQPKTQVVVKPVQVERVELFDKKKSKQYAAEFLGTFLLVLTYEAMSERVNLSNFNPQLSSLWLLMGAITIGGMATILVYTHQWISGAHFNPAITFGVMFRFNMVRKGPLLIYILTQLLAAAGASILFNYFFEHPDQLHATDDKDKSKVEVHIVPNVAIVFFTEFIFTFLLASAYFHTIYNRKLRGNQFYGIVIGAVYGIAIIVIGPGTGGILNPAIWFGTVVQRYIFKKASVVGWVYIGAHIVAALVAAMLQKSIFADDCETVDCGQTLTYTKVGQQDDLAGGEDSNPSDSHVVPFRQGPDMKDAEFFFKNYHSNANVKSADEPAAAQQLQQNRIVPNTQFQYQK